VTFWAIKVIHYLLENENLSKININQISNGTFIDENDVLYILENFRILRRVEGTSQSHLYLKREYLTALLEGLGVKRNPNTN
jgi:hypothetical protein